MDCDGGDSVIDIEQARKRAQDAIERAKRAAPGRWVWNNKDLQQAPVIAEEFGPDIAVIGDPDSGIWICDDGCCYEYRAEDYANAEFISEARTDVPQLATDLLQALKDLEHWKANHDEMKARNDFLRSRPDMHYKDVHEHNHRLAVLDQLDAALDEIERLKETISDPPRRSL